MMGAPAKLTKRLLFILHRGLVEARNLALAKGTEQIADLADALEVLPCLLDQWEDSHLELIRQILDNYDSKYPGRSFNLASYLEQIAPPERF
jgi:hypothetical protein